MKLDMRKLRIGNKNELFEDASKESLNLDPAQKPAKAGNPIIRVDPDNEKKIIQSVGYLVKNSGKSFNLHLKLLEILFGLLGTLHQIFPDTDCPTSNLLGTSFIAISDFSASVTGLNFLFEDPSLSIFFGMELFKALFRRICKFTPSFLPFLETNNWYLSA